MHSLFFSLNIGVSGKDFLNKLLTSSHPVSSSQCFHLCPVGHLSDYGVLEDLSDLLSITLIKTIAKTSNKIPSYDEQKLSFRKSVQKIFYLACSL